MIAHDKTRLQAEVELAELIHDGEEMFVDQSSRADDRELHGSDGDIHECRGFVDDIFLHLCLQSFSFIKDQAEHGFEEIGI